MSIRTGSKTILLTGGRAPVTLDLARSFHRFGHRVLIAESLEQNVSRVSNSVDKHFLVRAPNSNSKGFVEDLLRIIRAEKVDLLVPTCEEVFYVSRGREELARECRVPVDTSEKLEQLHNKWTFNQRACEIGPAPKSSLAKSQRELEALAAERPIVIKPAYSRFASNSYVLKKGDALPEVSASASYPWVVQQFISGRELCSYSFAEKGKLVAHSAYSHEFTAGKGAGICFEAVEHPKIQAWVSRLASELSITGQISFDFIETSDGEIYPLECNPRATSGAHLFAPADRLDLVLLGEKKELTIPRVGSMGMIGLAMLVYGLPSVNSFKRLKEWIRTVWSAREVSFDFRDPFPFFYQFLCLFGLWRQSLKNQVSMLEVSTQDIEWNGEK